MIDCDFQLCGHRTQARAVGGCIVRGKGIAAYIAGLVVALARLPRAVVVDQQLAALLQAQHGQRYGRAGFEKTTG